MCFHSIELHVAPDGATSLGFVRGYKHFAPPEQGIPCPLQSQLRAFNGKSAMILLVPKRFQGIDFRRPACWNITSQ